MSRERWANEGGADGPDEPIDPNRDELRHSFDREIAVSRALAVKLEEADATIRRLENELESCRQSRGVVVADRDTWRCNATNMAESFMRLHNLAKNIVGPRP